MGSRCYYLDFAKVITALLVIFGHLYGEDSTVRLYLYAFHMPLFFLISGIFHQNTGHIEWKKYCTRILWPTFIFILLSILSSVLEGGTIKNPNIVSIYCTGLLTGRLEPILWFLFALFWCKVFTDCLFKLNRPVLAFVGWSCFLFIPILLNRRLPFEMTQGLIALPFYLLGYRFQNRLLSLKPDFKWIIAFLGSAAICFLITRVHGRVSLGFISFGQLATIQGIDNSSLPIYLLCFGGDVLLFYLNGVIGSIMVISLALLPLPENPAVSQLSKALITVVGTQYLFINPILHSIGYDNTVWVTIPLSIGILILCYMMHQILRPVYRIAQ